MPVLSLHNASNYSSIPTGSASYSLGLSGAQGGSSYAYPSASASAAAAAAAAAAASNAAINSILSGAAAAAAAAGTGSAGYSSILGTVGGLSGLGATNPLSSTLGSLGGGLGGYGGGLGSAGYSTFTNPLLTGGVGSMSMKLKTYDDLDLLARSYGAGRTGTTPSSPIPSAAWGGLDGYGLDGVNPTFMHTHSRHGLDLDGECVCV